MKPPVLFSIIVAGLALLALYGSAYTVSETEQVIITQFGKPVGNTVTAPGSQDPIVQPVTDAGLHFKVPFIQDVNRFDHRILQWDGASSEMPTRDKLYIVVDAFARWRIADPLKYFQSLRDERSALSRLSDIIGSEMRNVVARHALIEVVRTDKNRKPTVDETLVQASPTVGVLPPIERGREMLEAEILEAASPKVKLWGIELLDIRFKRINYKAGVIEKIYERMTSERMQIAERFRSEGGGEAAKILGKREKDLRQIESDAYRKIQDIRGKADAEATSIYSQAYNTSPVAADFYQFMKTLETYKSIFDSDTTVIFTTESDLFKFLKKMDGGVPSKATQPVASVPVTAKPAPAPVVVKPSVQPAPAPAPQIVPPAPAPEPSK
jgi:modulator of FtsH protease HflC